MKPYSLILIFLLSLFFGIYTYCAIPSCYLSEKSHTVYAPPKQKYVDYSAGYISGSGTININTASLAELDLLSGIGKEYAMRIIKHRTLSGEFEVIEDIMKVPGIGEKRFMKIKDKISVK